MPYPPVKTENYQNLGGLNKKASPYMTGTREVIDILNFDYTQPGSYTTRPGTTGWITGLTGTISNLTQFSTLEGNSYLIFSNSSKYFSYTGTTTFILSQYGHGNIASFAPFVDRLFVADNSIFYKTNGATAYLFSLPDSSLSALNIGTILQNVSVGHSTSGAYSGMTGIFVYGFAWVNERGYMGPVPAYNYNDLLSSPPVYDFPGIQVATNGGTAVTLTLDITDYMPSFYGISYLAVFRNQIGFPDARGSNASTIQSATLGTLLGNWYGLTLLGLTNNYVFVDAGLTFGPSTTGPTLAGQQLWFTLAPSLLNVYSNYLFMGGFGASTNGTGLQSTVYFSALGEPELVGYTQGFQVRTNDSDYLTGFYNYISQQMIFKNRSAFSLTGSNPPFSVNQITADYGCISNRAIVSYNQLLWFLDRKGICQYDGANVSIISNRVESVFQSMNLSAAEQTACMIHVKDRNEVWTAIPVNGATLNNQLVIFDYVADAFSLWSGPEVASIALAFDPNQVFTPIYGNYSGIIHYFNPKFFTDSGNPYTCSVTPRYFGGQGQEMGYSVEKMFRRAYFDITDSNNTGQTTIMNVNFISDFGTSQVITGQTFAMGAGHTQMRLDVGIPAKAASFQLYYIPKTSALNFNGYTVEYRYQRNT